MEPYTASEIKNKIHSYSSRRVCLYSQTIENPSTVTSSYYYKNEKDFISVFFIAKSDIRLFCLTCKDSEHGIFIKYNNSTLQYCCLDKFGYYKLVNPQKADYYVVYDDDTYEELTEDTCKNISRCGSKGRKIISLKTEINNDVKIVTFSSLPSVNLEKVYINSTDFYINNTAHDTRSILSLITISPTLITDFGYFNIIVGNGKDVCNFLKTIKDNNFHLLGDKTPTQIIINDSKIIDVKTIEDIISTYDSIECYGTKGEVKIRYKVDEKGIPH